MTIGANVPCAHGSIPFPAWNKEAYPPWLVKKRWMCGWVSAGEKFWVRRKEEKEGGEGKEFSNTALLTSLYVRGEKTFLNMVQKTVFSYPHWPLFIRTTFLKANFTTEGKGDFRASVARENKSKKEEGVCGHKGSTLLPPPSVGAGVLFKRRKRMEGQESRQLPRERERAHCRLEHTPIVAPSHSVSLKRAQDATLPKWRPTQRREGGEGKGGPLPEPCTSLFLPFPSAIT